MERGSSPGPTLGGGELRRRGSSLRAHPLPQASALVASGGHAFGIGEESLGTPAWLSGEDSTFQCKRHRFDP